MELRRVETGSLPEFARRYSHDFTFYVAHPVRSILFILSKHFVFSELAFAAATLPQSVSSATSVVKILKIFRNFVSPFPYKDSEPPSRKATASQGATTN